VARVLAEGAAAAGLDAGPFAPCTLATSGFAAFLAEHPFVMAPMAGVSDAAWRLMARAGGAPVAYTEMVSATGIYYHSDKTFELAVPNPAEGAVVVQLFGSNVAHMRYAAALVAEELGPRLAAFDLNMACPVSKVVKKGEGSALLDTPELAEALVAACVEAGGVPVSVKMRLGRRMGELVAPTFARRMAAAGATAVGVHGRYASQLYRGESDAAAIARVVEAVDIPVIASGDVTSAQAAVALKRATGAAGVFVARGTYGNPWIFNDAQGLVAAQNARGATQKPREVAAAASAPDGAGKPATPAPFSAGNEALAGASGRDIATRMAAFCLHVRLLEATGAHLARARNLAGWYVRGVPEAAAWRRRAMAATTVAQYEAVAAACVEACRAAGVEV
jgi:nifR3 family TIM-barrel protein